MLSKKLDKADFIVPGQLALRQSWSLELFAVVVIYNGEKFLDWKSFFVFYLLIKV